MDYLLLEFEFEVFECGSVFQLNIVNYSNCYHYVPALSECSQSGRYEYVYETIWWVKLGSGCISMTWFVGIIMEINLATFPSGLSSKISSLYVKFHLQWRQRFCMDVGSFPWCSPDPVEGKKNILAEWFRHAIRWPRDFNINMTTFFDKGNILSTWQHAWRWGKTIDIFCWRMASHIKCCHFIAWM
jgi:hypothetical protein